MLEAMSARLHIGLARDGVAVVRTGGWPRRRVLAHGVHALAPAATATSDSAGPAGQALDALLDALLARIAAGPGGRRLRADVVLSDDLVRHWIVAPPVNARSIADCRLAAQGRFLALFGQDIDGWHWDADWRADRPFLASALPKPLLTLLQQRCQAHGLRLAAVSPELVTGWNRWRRRLVAGDWLASACGRRLTLIASDGAGLRQVGRLLLPADLAAAPATAGTWLQQAVQREALRWMLEPPRRLCWSGQAPAPWQPAGTPPSPQAADWTCTVLAPSTQVAECLAAASEADRPALQLALAAW